MFVLSDSCALWLTIGSCPLFQHKCISDGLFCACDLSLPYCNTLVFIVPVNHWIANNTTPSLILLSCINFNSRIQNSREVGNKNQTTSIRLFVKKKSSWKLLSQLKLVYHINSTCKTRKRIQSDPGSREACETNL